MTSVIYLLIYYYCFYWMFSFLGLTSLPPFVGHRHTHTLAILGDSVHAPEIPKKTSVNFLFKKKNTNRNRNETDRNRIYVI